MVNFVPAWMRGRPPTTLTGGYSQPGGYGSNGTGYNDDNSIVRGVYATRIRQHPGTGNTVAPTATPAYRGVPNPDNIEAAIAAALSSSSYRQAHHVEQNIEQNNRWYKSPVTSALACLAGGILILAGGMLYTVTRPASSDARQPTAQVQTVDSLPSAQAPLSGLPTDRQDQVQRARLPRNSSIAEPRGDLQAAGQLDNPAPSKFVYTPLGRWMQSPDGKVAIDCIDANCADTMVIWKYVKDAHTVYSRLEKLFGATPKDHYILQVENGAGTMMPLAVAISYWVNDEDLGTDANETSSWFMNQLLGNMPTWFVEGFSNYASGYVELGAPKNYDFAQESKWGDGYDKVVSGELKLDSPEWLDSHSGSMLFAGASKYHGLDDAKMTNIFARLIPISKSRFIYNDDIEDAFAEELGEGVREVFDYVRPVLDANPGSAALDARLKLQNEQE